jgi:hypothetical protein
MEEGRSYEIKSAVTNLYNEKFQIKEDINTSGSRKKSSRAQSWISSQVRD